MNDQFNKKLLAHIGALISIGIVCLALSVMYQTLHEIRIDDVLKHVRELSVFSIFGGFLITTASYFVVTGYDVVALNHVKRRVPYARAALSAFLASTFGNNIGFAIVTGTSIRYRVYSQVGLSAMEIAGVSTLCALTTTLGMSFIFAITMTLQGGDAAPSGIPISPQLLRLAGVIVLIAIVGYVSYAAFKPITLRTENWSLQLPSAPTALAQIALATTNLMLVGSLIYVLLPADVETSYITFLGVFALALIAGSAFIMYQIKSKSWVALGDPVGPREEHAELIGKFRGLCERYGAWPVYYLVDGDHLPLYEQLDLAIDKIGDDAMMPLEAFSLKGPMRAELDQVYQRLRKQGIKLEIVDQAKVENLLPQLLDVSDDWLTSTQHRETGFARGFFDPYYVINFPCTVVRRKRKIIAFAVIWASPDKSEIALDLIRYHHDAPPNVKDFLILELMLTARKQGYRWFKGTAPLPGLEKHPLAPLWHRVGGLMYQQHDNFSAIDNLQSHESVLNPVWRPKYLVSPGGAKLPRVLRDISRLVSERKTLRRADDKGLQN